VRDPDGVVRERREFDNAITSGDLVVSLLLSRQAVLKYWFLTVAHSAAALHGGPCIATSVACFLREPGDPGQANTHNLVVKNVGPTATSPSTPFGVNLQASFVAGVDSDIGSVLTDVRVTMADSRELGYSFSRKVLTSPIVVKNTQTVSVSATINLQ
jgi:hypothetical protein